LVCIIVHRQSIVCIFQKQKYLQTVLIFVSNVTNREIVIQTVMIQSEILCQSPIFRGISSEDLSKLFEQVHYQVKTYRKGEVVVVAGDICNRLLILQEGSVKAEMTDYSGKTIKIEDMTAPWPLATAFLFGKENRFPVTVSATSDAQLISIPKSEFVRLLQMDALILNNYLNTISTRAQFLSQKLKFLSFKTIKQKISHYLLELAGERLQTVEIQQSQGQLAEMFGVTRPSLARTLGEMSQEGLIDVDRRYIKIVDKVRMSQLLKGQDG
jgi:CRP/FNR family transcriptional regulator, dissimilatory nitrate respiration regulator